MHPAIGSIVSVTGALHYGNASFRVCPRNYGDIVTELISDTEIFAIGGNVGDSVTKTRLRRVGGQWMNAANATHQVFCLMRAIADPAEDLDPPNFTIMRLPEN